MSSFFSHYMCQWGGTCHITAVVQYRHGTGAGPWRNMRKPNWHQLTLGAACWREGGGTDWKCLALLNSNSLPIRFLLPWPPVTNAKDRCLERTHPQSHPTARRRPWLNQHTAGQCCAVLWQLISNIWLFAYQDHPKLISFQWLVMSGRLWHLIPSGEQMFDGTLHAPVYFLSEANASSGSPRCSGQWDVSGCQSTGLKDLKHWRKDSFADLFYVAHQQRSHAMTDLMTCTALHSVTTMSNFPPVKSQYFLLESQYCIPRGTYPPWYTFLGGSYCVCMWM